MNVSYTTIGQNIRRARSAANLSVQEAAELMGISLLYYQRFENGERPVSLETLALICQTLHCSVSSLLANAFDIRKISSLPQELMLREAVLRSTLSVIPSGCHLSRRAR